MGNALPENYLDVQRAAKALGLLSPETLAAALSALSLTQAQSDNIRALLAASAPGNVVARSFMVTPPAMIVKAAYTASSELGGIEPTNPNVLMTDPLLSKTGPWRLLSGTEYIGDWLSQGNFRIDGGDGHRLGIRTNSRYVGLAITFSGTVTDSQRRAGLRINGQYARIADFTMYGAGAEGTRPTPDNFDSQPHWVVFDLGSTATRDVEIFLGQNVGVHGLGLVSGATKAALTAPTYPARWLIPTDSWGGTQTSAGKNGFYQRLAERLGDPDPLLAARPGQGYARTTDSPAATINTRLIQDIAKLKLAGPINGILLPTSVNDGGSYDINLTAANYALAIQTCQTEWPDLPIVCMTGHTGVAGGSLTTLAKNTVLFNAARAVADRRTVIVDTRAIGVPPLAASGTLPNGQPYDDADLTHNGVNGIEYRTDLEATAIRSALQKLAST